MAAGHASLEPRTPRLHKDCDGLLFRLLGNMEGLTKPGECSKKENVEMNVQ